MENNQTNFSEGKSIEITQAEKEMLYPAKKKINKKVLFFAIVFILYTVLAGFVGAQIERKIIMNRIQSSFEDAFGTKNSEGGKISDDTGTVDETTTKAEKQPVNIKLRQKQTINNLVEFTLENSSWAEEIKPSDTSFVYTYKSDTPGEKYFVIKGKVKSLAAELFDFDDISSVEILINGQYKFTGYIEVEETDKQGFDGSIKPLQESVVIVYASVTDDAYEICKDVKVSIKMQSELADAGWRFDEEKPYEYYTLTLNNKGDKQ